MANDLTVIDPVEWLAGLQEVSAASPIVALNMPLGALVL